jgi:hypothetical protein
MGSKPWWVNKPERMAEHNKNSAKLCRKW